MNGRTGDMGLRPSISAPHTSASVFVELFAGVGGLSRAVQRLGLEVKACTDFDQNYEKRTGFNLLNRKDLESLSKLIKGKAVRWLHAAPPCSTFSRARRSDAIMKFKPIRSPEHPEGLGPPALRPWRVLEANLLARRTASLCLAQARSGGAFSIENPENSLLWLLPSMLRLRAVPGARATVGDQCCFGGAYIKSTLWLSNAPWISILERRCPGEPDHPPHIVLRGLTEYHDGTVGWRTARAAEYPQGLCEALAGAYANTKDARGEVQRVTFQDGATVDPLRPPTLRRKREQENTDAIGGMRNPHLACERIPGWKRTGALLRDILEPILDKHLVQATAALSDIGRQGHPGLPQELVAEAVLALEQAFPAPAAFHHGPPTAGATPVRAHLLAGLVYAAGDPDDVVADWFKHGTPLGIHGAIPTRGIFPPSGGLEDSRGSLEQAEELAPWTADAGNYASFDTNADSVEAELKRELDKGFLEWSASLKELESKYGQLLLSRMAAIVKVKNGHTKTRLIHDLRRSRVNDMARIPERIVLPRLFDAVHTMIGIAKECRPGEAPECVVLDFKDAFKHLPVHPSERRFVAGQASINGVHGFFVYLTILFGAIGGPLVWGRVAALLMRIAAACVERDRTGLQCYVDDPLAVVRGDLATRNKQLLFIVVLWVALGFELSWAKGARGIEVDWIGAHLAFVFTNNAVTHVTATVNKDKVAELSYTVNDFLGQSRLDRRALKRFAGLATWVGSIIPAMKPYCSMLWAAATAPPAGAETNTEVSAARVRLPLQWIAALAADGFLGVARRFPLHPPGNGPVVAFDASLAGGGATLTLPNGRVYYFALTWTPADHRLLNARRGDPAAQAAWEAYALLVATWTWRELLAAAEGRLAIHGDAKGVLQSVVFGRAKAPVINSIVAEIQLALGSTMHGVTAAHFWSEENHICDALSRLGEGALLPHELAAAERWPAERRAPWRILSQLHRA